MPTKQFWTSTPHINAVTIGPAYPVGMNLDRPKGKPMDITTSEISARLNACGIDEVGEVVSGLGVSAKLWLLAQLETTDRNPFFAKLKPFSAFAFDDEHRRLGLCDHDSDDNLVDQQLAFLRFLKQHQGQWARFRQGSNGYIYAIDSDEVVIISPDWLEGCTNVKTPRTENQS